MRLRGASIARLAIYVALLGGFVWWRTWSRGRPASTPIARGSSPSPLTPARRVKRKEIDFTSGEIRLRGTLSTPDTRPPHAGVVIAHGRTPLGRRHELFVVMAERLAEKGCAVLTFDFRGFGQSGAPPVIDSPDDLDFVADVSAALSFLESTGVVNRNRLFLIGHSFGGGVVLAAALSDPRVNRVVSISPPRRCEELYFGAHPTNRMDLQRMMTQSMNLGKPAPIELLYPVLKTMIPDVLPAHPTHPPILFIQGGLEATADLEFLKRIHESMTEPKGYVVIADAAHYFGTPIDTSEQGATFRPKVMRELVDSINAWFRSAPHRPK